MSVRKQRACRRRQTPVHGWAPAAGAWRADALDQFSALQRLEVLTNRRVGEAEFGGELGGSRALSALEPLDDAALGTGQVAADIGDGEQSNDGFTSPRLRNPSGAGRELDVVRR